MCTIKNAIATLTGFCLLGSVAHGLDAARSCSPVDQFKNSSVVCADPKAAIFVAPTSAVTGVALKFRDAKKGREANQEFKSLKISFAEIKDLNWKNAKEITKAVANLEKTWKSKFSVEVSQVEFDKSAKLYTDSKMVAEANWINTKVERNVASVREKILTASGVGRAQKK